MPKKSKSESAVATAEAPPLKKKGRPPAVATPTKGKSKATTNGAAPKAKVVKTPRVTKSDTIRTKVLSFMRKGKELTTREIVLGIGLTPGSKEGDPVIAVLKKLLEEKLVKVGPNSAGRRFSWIKN